MQSIDNIIDIWMVWYCLDLRIFEAGGCVVDIHRVGFAGGEITAQGNVLFEEAVDLGAYRIPGPLCGYCNVYYIIAAVRFYIVKGGATVSKSALDVDKYLLRV